MSEGYTYERLRDIWVRDIRLSKCWSWFWWGLLSWQSCVYSSMMCKSFDIYLNKSPAMRRSGWLAWIIRLLARVMYAQLERTRTWFGRNTRCTVNGQCTAKPNINVVWPIKSHTLFLLLTKPLKVLCAPPARAVQVVYVVYALYTYSRVIQPGPSYLRTLCMHYAHTSRAVQVAYAIICTYQDHWMFVYTNQDHQICVCCMCTMHIPAGPYKLRTHYYAPTRIIR